MPIHASQPSFAGGEIAPALYSRTDLAKYASGCRTVRNFLIRSDGAASNRPGTRYVASTKIAAKKARLVEFEFSTTQAYVIEFGDLYCRFYKDGGQITSAGSPVEIVTPYTEAELPSLRFTQSADILYITHPSHAPRTLTRTSHTVWTMAVFPYVKGPFMLVNTDDDLHLTASAVTGAGIDLTTDFDLFAAGHLGGLFKLNHFIQSQTISGSFSAAGTGQTVNGTLRSPMVRSSSAYCSGDWSVTLSGTWADLTVILQKSTDNGMTWSTLAAWTANGTYTGTEASACMLRLSCLAVGLQSIGYALTAEQELLCQGSWRMVTHGTWSGKFHVEKSDDSGTTWKVIRSYSSAADKNYDITGQENESCVLRVRCFDYSSGPLTYDLIVDPYTHAGIVQITSVTNARAAVATVVETLGATTATNDWAEGSWSDYRGWPAAVGFHEDRLCFGYTNAEPQGIWCSQTSDYTNFGISNPIVDTDRIALSLNSRKVNAIRALVSLDDLVALTGGSEWLIGSGENPFAPATVRQKCQSYHGSADVEPVIVGKRVIFVQNKGATVRDLGYTYESNGYDGQSLIPFAPHLFKKKTVIEMAYQQEPDSIVWVVRSDGVLLGLTYVPEQEILAWHRHDTDGEFESVCVIPASGYDEVWAIVKRTIGGSTVRYVERFAERIADPDAPEDSFYCDSGLTYDGAPATVISGLTHLIGEEVAILADGIALARQTVAADGSITLPAAASVVQVGLPIIADLEPVSIEVQTGKGTIQSQRTQIPGAVFMFENSRGGDAGPDSAHLDPVSQEGTGLFTGRHEQTIPSDFVMGATVFFRQTDPYPVTITGILPKVTPGG